EIDRKLTLPSWTLQDGRDAINMFKNQFHAAPPPTFSFHTAQVAIEALIGLGVTLQEGSSELVVRLYESSWPSMWKWIDHVYWGVVVELDLWNFCHPHERETFRNTIVSSLQFIIAGFLQGSTSSIVVATEGVLQVAFDIFLRLGSHPPSDHAQVPPLCRSTYKALTILLKSTLSDFNEVREAVFSQKHGKCALFQPLHAARHGGY
ncbi:hypothetical protein DXG01_006132, partial [Tephrocybe rancida]